MANSEHIAKLLEGAQAWNDWRNANAGSHPDLSNIDFYTVGGQPEYSALQIYSGFDFSHCALYRASLRNCIFEECDFSNSRLSFSDLVDSHCTNCNFQGARLNVSKIGSAKFISCDFTDAELSYCSAEETSFIGSTFVRTKLNNMSLVGTDFSNTTIDSVLVYGTSAWDLNLAGSVQQNIYISNQSSTITVPDIELAQFIALLVNNSKIREIIDTITSKVVLILGRFTKSRKAILDEIKNELQVHGYVPVLFDFEGPQSRDLTETIITLASISKFVVADLSMAKSIPQELSSFVPHFPSIPVQLRKTVKTHTLNGRCRTVSGGEKTGE
jgi:uncharacterized protein YjbI with pentapeptide repeats